MGGRAAAGERPAGVGQPRAPQLGCARGRAGGRSAGEPRAPSCVPRCGGGGAGRVGCPADTIGPLARSWGTRHVAVSRSHCGRGKRDPADDFPTGNGRDEDVQGIVLRSEGVEECINVLHCSSVDGPASAIGICLRNPTELAHIGHRASDIEQIVHRQCVAARSFPGSWKRRSTIAGRHASRHSEMDDRGSTIDAALSRVDDRGHRGSMVDRSMGDRTAESH